MDAVGCNVHMLIRSWDWSSRSWNSSCTLGAEMKDEFEIPKPKINVLWALGKVWYAGAIPILIFCMFAQQTWWSQRISNNREIIQIAIDRDIQHTRDMIALIKIMGNYHGFDGGRYMETHSNLRELSQFILDANPTIWGIND